MKTSPRICIAGGGPTGLVCALLLKSRGFDARVFDARPLAQAQRDVRLLALARGSWTTLDPLLGAAALPRAEIRDVYVSSAGEFGVTHLPARDGAALGATVYYGDLLTALAQAAAAAGIEITRPAEIADIAQHADGVSLHLQDGTTIDADLAIVAEGAPQPAAQSSAESEAWAMLAPLAVATAAGAAFERFTREGPLALLPAPSSSPLGAGAQSGAQPMALVWCMSARQAQRRGALDDAAFTHELQAAMGPRLGKLLHAGARHRMPLTQAHSDTPVEHRVVRLGNAAQTLHPVAGQGFNLGLRDCVVLADTLAQAESIDAALSQFAARRASDRRAIVAITAALPQIFATRFAPVGWARAAGLNVLNVVPPLRDALAHLLMFGVRA
jgi:2-octaprenyl-6-methoxyphenol hydroxylase